MTTDLAQVVNTKSSKADSSQSDVLGDDKIRRSLLKIPSDQKELFRAQTWAHALGQRPNGFVNVPPHVLEQVKALHTRRQQETNLTKATGPISDAENDSDAPEPSGSQSSASSRVKGDEDGDKGVGDRHLSEPTSGISSPNASLKSHGTDDKEPSQPLLTQLSEKSPIRPTFVLSSPKHSKIPEFPSSSGVEDELEVEVPAALAYNPPPINRSALPMLATPPSAQVVPCTFEQSMEGAATTSSTEAHPQNKNKPKKHVYKPVPELYRGPNRATSTSHLTSNAGLTKATSTSEQSLEEKRSLPTDTNSSSIIPPTLEHRGSEREKPTMVRDVRPAQMLTHFGNPNPKNSHIPSTLSGNHPEPMSISSPSIIHLPQPPTYAAAQTAVQTATGPKTWEAPFIRYTVTYPDYNGSIQDFVTACIYIQLQYRRIRTSLYDDFIRAWADGYLPYVKECDESRPPRRALRAIEWYNDIDDDPLFTSRVVTRQNLRFLLNCYPEEVETARLSLGLSPRQGPRKPAVPHSHAELDIHEENAISPFPTSLRPLENREAQDKSDRTRTSEYGPTPISIPMARASVADERPQADRSFSGSANHPAQYKDPPRPVSESTLRRKRSPTYEHHPGEAKRISLGFLSNTPSRTDLDSGSTSTSFLKRPTDPIPSSSIPESTRRQNSTKGVEDAEEKRRRRLARHFQKRLAGKESIASSAPISSPATPRPK